jgi:hypothetical protein
MMPDAVLSGLAQTHKKIEANIKALPNKEKSSRIRLKSSYGDLMRAERFREEALIMLQTAEQRLVKTRQQHGELTTQIENISKLKTSADLRRAERVKEEALIMLQTAEQRLVKTRQKHMELTKDLEKTVRLKQLCAEQLQDINEKISVSRSRLESISIYFAGTSWQSMFMWNQVLMLSISEFEVLLKSIKSLYESCQQWHKSVVSGASSPEKLESIKLQIEADQRVLINGFRQRLNDELSRLPLLPPGADPEAHNLALSKRIQLQEEISAYRDYLESQWYKSPDDLLLLFR